MFSKNNVTQSMIDAVESVLVENKKLLLEPEKKKEEKDDDSMYTTKAQAKKIADKEAAKEVHKHERHLHKGAKETELGEERHMSDDEMKKREHIVKSMKKGLAGFKERYGNRAKNVMYATATKQAMKEEVDIQEEPFETDGPFKNRSAVYRSKNVKTGATIQHTGSLKQQIKSTLGNHTKPNLPGANRTMEEVELDEAMNDNMHPTGVALLKHIKPEHHNLYKPHLTTDVFNGSFKDRHDVLSAAKQAGHLKEDIGAMQSVVGEDKGKKAIRVDTLKGVTTSTDPEVKIANAHFSGKSATLKAEGKGTDTAIPFVTDSATHKEINKSVKPTFKKIKEMLGKTGTSE